MSTMQMIHGHTASAHDAGDGGRSATSGVANRERRTALAAGVLFIITFITSIPALLLFGPVLDDPGYITGAGHDGRIFLGATLELILIIANIATAIVLYRILKRQSEGLALGFVAARIMECVFIAVGILSVLTVVTLRQDTSGADAGSLRVAGQTLVAIKDWTFLLGPGFVVGIGNGLMLGLLMYRSGLMSRRLALLGIVGGPMLCACGVAVMFGVIDQGGLAQALATIPEILWEASIGLVLTFKGFRPSPLLAG